MFSISTRKDHKKMKGKIMPCRLCEHLVLVRCVLLSCGSMALREVLMSSVNLQLYTFLFHYILRLSFV